MNNTGGIHDNLININKLHVLNKKLIVLAFPFSLIWGGGDGLVGALSEKQPWYLGIVKDQEFNGKLLNLFY